MLPFFIHGKSFMISWFYDISKNLPPKFYLVHGNIIDIQYKILRNLIFKVSYTNTIITHSTLYQIHTSQILLQMVTMALDNSSVQDLTLTYRKASVRIFPL